MVLEDMILTASELRYVMDDIKDGDFSPNFVENSVPVQQLLEETVDSSGFTSSQNSTSDPGPGTSSDCKPAKRKKMRRSCDSTQNVGSTSSGLGTTVPCLEPYAGVFNFQLQLPADSSTHRWTYSKVLDKVFIDIDKVLALQFRWNFNDVKSDVEMFVRAMPVYTIDDSLNIPVIRCPVHKLTDNALNNDHVMRCEHSITSYEKDPSSQRFSCRTPLSRPQPGSDTTTLTYKFVCKTSCLGGMNRKPISVIFTLEDARGHEYGRQKLAVKICSCPKRDKMKEEKNETDKNEPAVRLPNANDSHPRVHCCLNTSVASTGNCEPLRDIRHVRGDDMEEVVQAVGGLHDKVDRMLQLIQGEMPFPALKTYLQRLIDKLSPQEQIELRDMIQQAIDSSSSCDTYV